MRVQDKSPGNNDRAGTCSESEQRRREGRTSAPAGTGSLDSVKAIV